MITSTVYVAPGEQAMSVAEAGPAGIVLEGLEFAREGRRMAGSVPIASLSRLVDVVADSSGVIEWEVCGEQDREGKSFLVLQLTGRLGLRCQRCLGTVVERLSIASRLMLVVPGQPWPDDELAEDGFDAIDAGKEMALLPMIEEEVLLALPVVPMHEICELPVADHEENEPSPFAVLAKLKKGV
jgi:uncharacterized protein